MEWKSAKHIRFNNAYEHQQIILRQQRQIILLYVIVTAVLFFDRWNNEMLLSQVIPPYFINRMDVSLWLFMFTNIHSFFLDNFHACLALDILLLLLPVIYMLLFLKKSRWVVTVGWIILVFNFVYAQCAVLYVTTSIEEHIGWMLFPLVLICPKPPDFRLALKFIRYVALFFFTSAGIWKIRNGGLFNLQEMSGIILFQHKDFLATSPGYFLTNMYYWLAQHPYASYFLYLGAAIVELFFIIGFFTTRLDRWLAFMFIIFLVSDTLIMRIKYWEILYLIIPLLYSRKEIFNNTGQGD